MSSPSELSARFAQVLLDSTQEPFWAVDRDKRLVFANRYFLDQFKRAFGISLKPGRSTNSDLYGYFPAIAALWDSLYDRVLAGQSVSDEQTFDISGDARTYLLTLNPVREGGAIIGASCMGKDITRLKAAQGSLRQSEERFSAVFHASPVPIILTAPLTGLILDANEAFSQMVGFSIQELVGRTTLELKLWAHPENRAELLETLNTRGYMSDTEFEFRRRNGEIGVALCAFVLTRFGNERWVVGLIEDITQRKRWEEHMRQTTKQEAVGRLAGGVAHDFNNLLTVILGASELLLSHPIPPQRQRKMLERIHSAAGRAAVLTRQLLAFGRQQPLNPERMDANAGVKVVFELLQRTLGEDITISMDLDPAAPCIWIDRPQFEQVLLNLAVNARDAMPDGGQLTFRTRSLTTADELPEEVPPGNYVLLEVTDTGTGIPKELQQRIFDPFFTTKPEGRGTGLGLSSVHGVVHQSGGRMRVLSTPGEGTTFQLFLPASEHPETPQPDAWH